MRARTFDGRALVLAFATLTTAASVAAAQRDIRPRPRAEARVDYLGPNPKSVQAGLGVNIPLGMYVRLAIVGAGGASWQDGESGASARGDVIARFSFDPFRERRWGLSAGGGLSVRYDESLAASGDRWRALIAIVLDLEGPLVGPVTPALQVGLGGGVRVGLILRGGDRFRR